MQGFLVGTPETPKTGTGKNNTIWRDTVVQKQEAQAKIDVEKTENTPTFKSWKGEEANEALKIAWQVSGGDKDFIYTLLAENGTFEPYRKHPKKNRDGSWDYAWGLNSYYHKDMVKRIKNKTVSVQEIIEYHWKIYNQPDWTTSCGKKKFCGYNKRHKVKYLIKFNYED